MIKLAYIKKLPGQNKWRIYSESGKNMGTFDTREAAKKHLAEIEFFKHKGSAASDDKLNKKYKMLKDMSNIAGYLEEAGFTDEAQEIYNSMNLIDNIVEEQDLHDTPLPGVQMNTENQSYMGGDGVGSNYSLLSMDIAQPTDDIKVERRQKWEDEIKGQFRFHGGIPEGDVHEFDGDLYLLYKFDTQLDAHLAFKDITKHPSHMKLFQISTPHRLDGQPEYVPYWYIVFKKYNKSHILEQPEDHNVDMIASSNGLWGNTVTDNGAAGQMGILSDTSLYQHYNNLEGRLR